jgi:hypothetical protein
LEAHGMADDPTGGTPDAAGPTGEETPRALTSEERLRALTSDRRRKVRKGTPLPVDPQRRPGDTVDAVRERTKDTGRDQPL